MIGLVFFEGLRKYLDPNIRFLEFDFRNQKKYAGLGMPIICCFCRRSCQCSGIQYILPFIEVRLPRIEVIE